MIAALPMYDRPQTGEANDRLWSLIRDRLGYGPAQLTRDCDLWEIWESPDLLLAQTCGLPLRDRLRGKVQLVASLVNDRPGCPPGHYFSVIVTSKRANPRRLADYATARLAFNQHHSQSGWAAAQNHAADHGFRFDNCRETGAHIDSARAVAEGWADIAVIDAVSWALICEHDDFAAELQVIGATDPTPGLPIITAPGGDVAALRAALASAVDSLSDAERACLHLKGIAEVPLGLYQAVPTPPAPAAHALLAD